jgi:hypothetical protein
MATTRTTNLKLRLDDRLTTDARFNLEKLDELGGVFDTDNTGDVNIRSKADINILPQDPSVGGTGTGGSVSIGTSGQSLTSINLFTDAFCLTGSGITFKSTFNTELRPAQSGQTSNLTFTLPIDDGDPGDSLKTDGSGTLSWGTPAGAGSQLVETWANADGTTKTVTHNFGTRNIMIQILDNDDDYQTLDVCVTRPTDNTAVLISSEAPTTNWTILLLEVS